MSIESYIVRVAGGAEKALAADAEVALQAAKDSAAYVDGVFVNDVEPFVEALYSDEVTVLKPFVSEALQELSVDLPTLLTQGIKAFWQGVAPALELTETKALAAGKAATVTDLLGAVGSVVTDAQAALGTASVAPTPSPAAAEAPAAS